jgi:very-short-patch-repair endonuclease
MDSTALRDVAIKVSTYFRDFLETDFKRQQAPRRRIVATTDAGFRASMRTSPYPTLDRALWTLLSRPSGEALTLSIGPRAHTRPVSPALLKVIEEHILAIPETALLTVRQTVLEVATTSYAKGKDDPEAWIEHIQTHLCEKVSEQIVRPLIANLGSLANQAYDLIDSLHAAETDLVQRAAGDLLRNLPEVLAKLLAIQDAKPLETATTELLTLDGVRTALRGFFESFAASDAYQELRDIETYVATSDGLQLYLYIGSVRIGPHSYPLFFVPLDVERSQRDGAYVLTFVNHLYANKRAIDFVLQELAGRHSRAWVSTITERITYLTPQQSIFEVAAPLFRSLAGALDLGGQITLGSTSADASTSDVRLSSALHLAAAEKSDEALLNDYEEIIDMARRGGSAIVDLFEGLVGDVLLRNPISIRRAVEDEWEGLPMVDRVVFDSPIPLNEEQRKVLLAVRKPEGKIIKVSGPPGTGKSHTITAIAADCAFNQRSCLVLSDKREALDVVCDKLSEAMSRVRHDPDFPNPILRLGRDHNNFKRLTSSGAVAQVAAYSRSMRANEQRIQDERTGMASALRQDIDRTAQTLGAIELVSVQAMHLAESELRELCPDVLAVLERCTDASVLPEIEALQAQIDGLEQYLRDIFATEDYTPQSLDCRARRDTAIGEFLASHRPAQWELFEALTPEQVKQLSGIVLAYRQLRMPVLGYLFRGARVRALEAELNALPATRPLFLKDSVSILEKLVADANALRLKLDGAGVADGFVAAYKAVAAGEVPPPTAKPLSGALSLLRRIDPQIIDALLAQSKDEARLWPLSIQFLARWLATRQAFLRVPQFDYVGTKSRLERLNTSVMNAHIDGRLISFMDNNRADARSLSGLISKRQKFPEDKFGAVRESFPVMVAGIREFGEFMPLVPELFDVVVIDEASQVSVAQALPALLRAKKVVVLGDDKQFSNVKSSNASIETNNKYRGDLVRHFRSEVSDQADVLQRLAMFDVKRSILDFASLTASYDVMLRKHFRSYPELIGYSSANFYNHQLQAIKIRGKPVADVVCFSEVKNDGNATRGINPAEADFILDELIDLLALHVPPTVGIITPFREQQTYLSKKLFGHTRGREFEDRLRLKVWTFDTCQGEERGIIFYSMVATREHDALNYIFPVNMTDATQEVEDKLKVQRLNVGFSRAQEKIWFVHSKPIEEFNGSIGQALSHYRRVLEVSSDQADAADTDASSPMEAKVLAWLFATPFYQQHCERIEVMPQFEIGEYLRQLDPNYVHPAWRVDFLVLVNMPTKTIQIVIEYDGFEHHFRKDRDIHIGNHTRYLHESDLERQLTLESYGYRFLRINRFNLGADPVATISDRLARLVELAAGPQSTSALLDQVKQEAQGLASRSLKACTRCKKIKPHEDFFDPALSAGEGGYGRVCLRCKA